MNLVLDEAEEVNIKTKARKQIGMMASICSYVVRAGSGQPGKPRKLINCGRSQGNLE